MFIVDTANNLRRLCTPPGDAHGRRWRVRTAVHSGRYLVRHLDTNRYRVVSTASMQNLW